MKTYFLRFALLVLAGFTFQLTHAQKQFNIWEFGQGAGLDFNSGSPVVLSGGMIYANEGSASIADETTGELLFYTDGVNVYDSTHSVMPNGTGLSGDVTTTQSALIVRQPGSDSLFYVFTVPADGGLTDLRYSIVDMTLNGGLGNVGVKNVFMATGSTIAEKATAIHHCNGTDWWIIFHQLGSNNYKSWLLNAAGLSGSPVTSAAGTVITTDFNRGLGWMTPSTDAKRIVLPSYSGGTVDIVDFDNEMGTMSGAIMLTGFTKPYGTAFSPSDQLLYITADMSLLQLDLSSGDSATIAASQINITTEANMMRAMRPGPDGKIYIAREWEVYLGVISNPDVAGTGCNYSSTGVNLSPGGNALGLPNTYSLAADPCPVGIRDAVTPEGISVYPQPATTVLHIVFEKGMPADTRISILGMQGQEVLRNEVTRPSTGRLSIPVESLPAGLYFLHISSGGQHIWRRLIIGSASNP